MAEMIGAQGEIFARAQAAELAEIMDEVRLIGVAGGEGESGPVNVVEKPDSVDSVLKPLNAAEPLGRHTDLVAEEFDEPALAEVHRLGHFGAGQQSWISLKLVQVDRHFKGDGPPIRRHIRGIM